MSFTLEEIYGEGREHVRWVSGYSDTIDREFLQLQKKNML